MLKHIGSIITLTRWSLNSLGSYCNRLLMFLFKEERKFNYHKLQYKLTWHMSRPEDF